MEEYDIWSRYIIPRLSVLLSDQSVWTNLDKFAELTGYVPEATNIKVIEALRDNKKPSTLSRLYATITRRPITTKSQLTDTLFDKSLHAVWRREMSDIKKLVKKHQDIMAKLQKAQQKCLDSNEPLQRIACKLDWQKMFVKQHKLQDECIGAIAKMEKKCDKAMMNHARNFKEYQKILDKENKCRKELDNMTDDLSNEIFNKMVPEIGRLMEETKQNTCLEELYNLSEKIQVISSRWYHFKPPTGEPCGQNMIAAPQLRESKVSRLGAIDVDFSSVTSSQISSEVMSLM